MIGCASLSRLRHKAPVPANGVKDRLLGQNARCVPGGPPLLPVQNAVYWGAAPCPTTFSHALAPPAAKSTLEMTAGGPSPARFAEIVPPLSTRLFLIQAVQEPSPP